MAKTFTIEDLKYMQSQPLWWKIQKSVTKIYEWYKYWEGNIHISFSGGKDSTVLLDLCDKAAELYNTPLYPMVFVDTGLEYPEIRMFVKSFGSRVTWLKPEHTFKYVLNTYGYPVVNKITAQLIEAYRDYMDVTTKKGAKSLAYKLNGMFVNGNPSFVYRDRFSRWRFLVNAPFKISDKCCNILKKTPLINYEKQTNSKPIIGVMATESRNRKNNYLARGCNAFNGSQIQSNPLGFWTEDDILEYLYITKIPYCSIYGDILCSNSSTEYLNLYPEANNTPLTLKQSKNKAYSCTGVNRTGCMFCLFGLASELKSKKSDRFTRMAKTHPKQYKYCMEVLKLQEVIDYVHTNAPKEIIELPLIPGSDYSQPSTT